MRFVIEGLGISTYGTKQVALEILQRLGNYPEHIFTLVFPTIPEFEAIAAPNITRHLMPKPQNLLLREVILNRYIPKLCRDQRADALLCMANFFPHRLPCRTAVLLQLPHVVYHEAEIERRFTVREKLIAVYGRYLYRHVPDGLLIIVQIATIKRRLESLYGIHPGRILVIPNAMPPFAPCGDCSSQGRVPREPFLFLCFGGYYSHKNLEILFDAFRKLPLYTSRPARGLMTIPAGQPAGARRLRRKIAQAGESSNISCIEPVSHDQLPPLYRSGHAYILPTLMETFSFTYDEAMHFGLPILTSDRDFAHERCEDAAVYFNPLDADSVAKAMARVMEDAELRQRLVENGKRLMAKEPSWDEIARRLVDALVDVAKGRLPEPEESVAAP